MNTLYKLSLTLLSISTIFAAEKEPVDYVDLFLGTSSSRWMLYPGPSMPFGMVKLSPDNTDEWQMNAGYEYEITSISGFGHVHSWMMGSFLTMPTTGIVKTLPGLMSNPDAGYRSRFRHEREEASPGYYAVYLDDYQLRAELTATTRSGFQRYTYPESRESHILFDLQIPEEGRPSILAAAVKKISPTEIAGYVKREAGWNEYTLHFVARLNRSFDSMSGWRGEEYRTDIDAISITDDRDIGVSLNFATREGEVVLLKTGISYVSIEQARLNLEQESSAFGWDFDLACEQARSTWNSLLGKIRVEGGRESDKIKFYTNLYRSYNARTIFSDVNGKYMDMCEIVRVLDDPDSPVYGCDAFWNTFWNLNQLWTLLTPDIANKWVRSLLEIYDRGGWLSKGPAGIEYSSIMVASHEIPLIVSAYQKGIRNYDVQKAYEAMKKIQTTIGGPHRCGGYVGNRNLKSYMEMGYVPADEGSVSNTLEYAYDDWCVAQLAKALGKKDDYAYFMQRSQYYKNIFDETSGYMRPKYKGGPWVEDFQPVIGAVGKEDAFGTKHYVEGNAWQFSWFVPQNVPGLIDLIGVEEFNRRLNDGFEAARPNFVSEYVNHSNQPNMQAAYLFNYSGKPWLTQKWVREILDNYYGLGPFDGYPGDEDQGQMGAWYVMSAMGLFEMDGGASVHPLYELGSPLFEKVTIELDKNYYPGGTFVIEAHHASAENQYIQSAMLNDRPLNNFWFSHDELVKGGSLVLEMAAEPNKNWAVNGMTAVKTDYPLIVSTPYVNVQEKMFKEKIQVPMLCNTPAALIYYTLDGGEPDRSSQRYIRPVELTKTTTIKMRAYRGETASLTATVIVRKSDSKVRESAQGLGQGISYRYFDGFFRDVHDLSDSKPGKEGIMPVFSIENREKEQYFGYEFAGFIHLEKAGPYTFFLTTNDGSRLYIDDMMVINNDGLHPAAEVSRQLNLAEGYHSFLIRYFQEGGTHHFQLEWQGPGFERQVIPASVLYHEKE